MLSIIGLPADRLTNETRARSTNMLRVRPLSFASAVKHLIKSG